MVEHAHYLEGDIRMRVPRLRKLGVNGLIFFVCFFGTKIRGETVYNPSSSPNSVPPQGTPVRYSKAIQLMHELSGALLCIDVREQLAKEGFAMKVVLKTVEPPSGAVDLCIKRFERLCCLTDPFPIVYTVFGCKSYAQIEFGFPM